LSNKKPMIAIVDDDKGAREALELLVRSLGHNTCTFGSAVEFLKSEKLHDTSCLISDVHMPGLSGLDLQDRLIANAHRMPIIFITGHLNESTRARAMEAGAVGFLGKPFKDNHLLTCIETALALKAA
jgi:FixJ family two-component response regulator